MCANALISCALSCCCCCIEFQESFVVMSDSKPDAAASGERRTLAQQIRHATLDETRAERLAIPANHAIFQSYNSERAQLEREDQWARYGRANTGLCQVACTSGRFLFTVHLNGVVCHASKISRQSCWTGTRRLKSGSALCCLPNAPAQRPARSLWYPIWRTHGRQGCTHTTQINVRCTTVRHKCIPTQSVTPPLH
jgi:hypothetical protein